MHKNQHIILEIEGEHAMLGFAANFAKYLMLNLQRRCCTVFLEGELGAGKTTFVRGFLQSLGYSEVVKSPTFTFVESYKLSGRIIHHFDLYRISRPEMLEDRGVRDYFLDNMLCFIEWPKQGAAYLPKADIVIQIEGSGNQRRLNIDYCHSSFRGGSDFILPYPAIPQDHSSGAI